MLINVFVRATDEQIDANMKKAARLFEEVTLLKVVNFFSRIVFSYEYD